MRKSLILAFLVAVMFGCGDGGADVARQKAIADSLKYSESPRKIVDLDVPFVCNYDGSDTSIEDFNCPSIDPDNSQGMKLANLISTTLDSILDSIGVARPMFPVSACISDASPNVSVLPTFDSDKGIQGLILVDSGFIEYLEPQLPLFLGHELGHVRQFGTKFINFFGKISNTKSSHLERELDADVFSGRVLYRMRKQLSLAVDNLRSFNLESGPGHHIPTYMRLNKIRLGYLDERNLEIATMKRYNSPQADIDSLIARFPVGSEIPPD